MGKRKLSRPGDPKDNDSAPLPQSEAEVPEGLELWDYYCPVRTPVHDKKFAYIDKELVSETFECPICLDVVKGTMVVTECMHRFCQECIEKTMRLGKKQCPTCRSQVPSRRALRSDKTFDEIAEILFINGLEHENNAANTNNSDNNGENNNSINEDEEDLSFLNEFRDTDDFSNAMDYRRRKTAKWDSLEEKEQEKLDEETRKIVAKYQTSDFAKLVISGMRKQRAIVEAQDKEDNIFFGDSSSNNQLLDDDATSTQDNDGDFVAPHSLRGKRGGRRRGRKPRNEAIMTTPSDTPTSPLSNSSRRGKRGSCRKRGSARTQAVSPREDGVSSNTSSESTTTTATSSSASSSTTSSNTTTNAPMAPPVQRNVYKSVSPGINIVLDPLEVDSVKDPNYTRLPLLERKFLMISGDATVGVVSKFLAGKFGVIGPHVALAMDCTFDLPVNTDAPKVVSEPGIKVVNPSVTLLELNTLKKKRNLLASPTLFFKYFYCGPK